jgi:hypothetical protein
MLQVFIKSQPFSRYLRSLFCHLSPIIWLLCQIILFLLLQRPVKPLFLSIKKFEFLHVTFDSIILKFRIWTHNLIILYSIFQISLFPPTFSFYFPQHDPPVSFDFLKFTLTFAFRPQSTPPKFSIDRSFQAFPVSTLAQAIRLSYFSAQFLPWPTVPPPSPSWPQGSLYSIDQCILTWWLLLPPSGLVPRVV